MLYERSLDAATLPAGLTSLSEDGFGETMSCRLKLKMTLLLHWPAGPGLPDEVSGSFLSASELLFVPLPATAEVNGPGFPAPPRPATVRALKINLQAVAPYPAIGLDKREVFFVLHHLN